MSRFVRGVLAPKADAVVDACEWLANSGIQNTTEDPTLRGGVHAWFDLRTGTYSFLYSEITAYAVNHFLFFYLRTQNEAYRERAYWAARWLLRTQDSESGLVKTRVYEDPTRVEPYYESWAFVFDQWMIVSGLCSVFQVTREAIFLEKARQIADFLIRHTGREDGFFWPAFNLPTGTPEATWDKWSREPGSFHAKALFGLLQLYDATEEPRYLDCADRLALRTCAAQTPEGRFVTQTSDQSTHLHPHAYTLEGLLAYGVVRKRSAVLSCVKRGLAWMLAACQPDGTLPFFYRGGHFLPFERVDVLAQALRVGAILNQYEPLADESKRKLDRIAQKLRRYQRAVDPQRGGFLYGEEQDGTVLSHVNAWGTMFAAQALWYYGHASEYPVSGPLSFFA